MQLGEQPGVLDRDHRLVGEGLEQLDLFVREGTHLCAANGDSADGGAFPKHRHGEHGAVAETSCVSFGPGEVGVGLRENIRDVQDATVEYGPPRYDVAENRNAFIDGTGWDRPEVCRRPEGIAIHAKDGRVVRVAQPRRTLRHGVQHRLQVGRRAADHTQDLAGGRLLLQRLGQVAITCLQFVEQPCVLDRDDRLVGEGLEHRDLPLGEHRRAQRR